MIKIEYVETYGWETAIRGMRNPMNSWDKSDSAWHYTPLKEDVEVLEEGDYIYCVGESDQKLMKSLVKAGSDHSKFMRMIEVSMDITAPMYWWAEMDTYKVGTVRNSCSKMHKLLSKPFEMQDFSFEKLTAHSAEMARNIVDALNILRKDWLFTEEEDRKKRLWYNVLQLLPDSYNQRSTVLLNYEVLHNQYHARKNHKLDEWHDYCHWIESLPFAELITLEG